MGDWDRHREQERDRERERPAPRTNVWAFSLQIGLFAGLIWGAVKIGASYFKFTRINSGFVAKPFFTQAYMNSTAGFWTGWLAFIAFSLVAALLYAGLFRKIRGPWMGLVYGASWWALLYLLFGPVMGMMRRIDRLDWNTIVTDFCFFLVWGLFIGYSISFEFTDEREREPSSPIS
ncbi:hypothetical protein DLM86_11080 [Paenibacillus flagellatus]|uniref:Uncharacterized protein n=2 Tax=Paenibacillus flagellatus TaxID=2211139 RepID=A0A2V5K895_9BACL|nr:hypothetical protein DLM86_11080 [Paenibacillus flagellatus]